MNKKQEYKSYGYISKSVMDSGELSQKAKLLYATISTYCGSKKECFPSQQLLAEVLSMSKSTVNRAIKELEKSGIVEIRKKQTQSGFKTNIYILTDGINRTA